MTTEDRVTRLETIIETQLTKIIEGVDSITPLKMEADEMKVFRREFDNKVRSIIAERLNTIQFEADVKETINTEVMAIFNKPEVRKDFEAKVQAIIRKELKEALLGMYIRLTLVVGGIATSLAVVVLKGLL